MKLIFLLLFFSIICIQKNESKRRNKGDSRMFETRPGMGNTRFNKEEYDDEFDIKNEEVNEDEKSAAKNTQMPFNNNQDVDITSNNVVTM